MLKKVLPFLIAIVMVFSLAACGKTADTPDTTIENTQTEQSEQETPTTESTEVETQPEETQEETEEYWLDPAKVEVTDTLLSSDAKINDFYFVKEYQSMWSDFRCLVIPAVGRTTVGEHSVAGALDSYIELNWDDFKDVPLEEIGGLLAYGDDNVPINGMMVSYSLDSDGNKPLTEIVANREFICNLGFSSTHETAAFLFGDNVVDNTLDAVLETCGNPTNMTTKDTSDEKSISMTYEFEDFYVVIIVSDVNDEHYITVTMAPTLRPQPAQEGE